MKRLLSGRRLAALCVLAALAVAGLGAYAAWLFRYSGVSEVEPVADANEPDADYTLDITPYYDVGALYVRQTIEFTNPGEALDRLVLCLPGNAYRRATTAPLDSDSFDEAFEDSYSPGGLEFKVVSVDGHEVEWGVSGTSEALLTLLCDVAEGASTTVYLEYYALIPEFEGAGGFGDDEWRLGEFYPYLAWLKDGEWTAYTPTYVGQYACAPIADYDVTLRAQSRFDVISTGVAAVQDSADGWNTWRITARDARELGIVMRTGGCAYERDVGGVKVRVYGHDRTQARRAIDVAAAALEFTSEIYAYPYAKLDIVLGDYAGRDWSISGLIIADGSDWKAQLPYLIARQWWGGLVGCDSMLEPWLSEALAQYCALECTRVAGLDSYSALRSAVDSAVGITLPGGLTVESEGSAFSSWQDYINVLRYRGAAVLELMDMAMDGQLTAALSEYARANAYGFAQRADFVAALNAVSGEDWSAWLNETLQGIGQAG